MLLRLGSRDIVVPEGLWALLMEVANELVWNEGFMETFGRLRPVWLNWWVLSANTRRWRRCRNKTSKFKDIWSLAESTMWPWKVEVIEQIVGIILSQGLCITRCACDTLMPPATAKSKIAIFRIKVTRSLPLVSIERAPLVDYACQISYLYWFKSYALG